MKERIMIHPGETMNSEERPQAAVNLQDPDRVSVSPLIYCFATTHAGITSYELYDPRKYRRAIDRCFHDLGPWDALNFNNTYYPEMVPLAMPIRVKEPGYGLPPDSIRQFVEDELMVHGDYGLVIRNHLYFASHKPIVEKIIRDIFSKHGNRGGYSG